MTEKRFTLAYEKGNWWAVKDGDITLWKEETIALLNSLNEENEQLKTQLSQFAKVNLEGVTKVQSLAKENEQLKQLIKKVLETTPIEHSLAIDLKNSIRELYE